MGFFDFIRRPVSVMAPSILSPYSPQDSITTLLVSELYPDHDTSKTLTRDVALRIPAVKRAHDVTCGVLARMPWRQYTGPAESTKQPEWLVTSNTGIAPRNLRWGVASDLFMSGWAAIAFELGDDDLPFDALHIPIGSWGVDKQTGRPVVTNNEVPAAFSHVVAIQLGYGSNGVLTDGFETLQDARAILSAYRDRIDNPIAQTMLTIAADRWDGWTKEEREEFRQLYMAARSSKGGATGMKPDWVTVDYSGELPTDLFESGRNANRLDIANHAGLPAGLLEGAKQSGGSDIHYSTEANGGTRNELWDFGVSKYADAIQARLSLDDVCKPGDSIRIDSSHYLTAPTPADPQTSED